ncbi:hypothetical protein [Pseudoneobacillus sp. C159]
MNLKELSITDLEELKKQINEELKSRVTKTVIYEHECSDCSKHHLNKYKHWSKVVKEVDITKNNGYGVIGDFLKVDKQHVVKSGSIIVETCGNEVIAYNVTEEGKEMIVKDSTSNFASFLQELNELI